MRQADKPRSRITQSTKEHRWKEHRWLSCERKVNYPTEGKVKAKAMEVGMDYYLCHYCYTFHLTKRRKE